MERVMAPEPILRAALSVLFVAGYTTRNWTITEEVSRKQINALWEALHEVPDLISRWREGAEKELLMYFDEYNEAYEEPRLRVIYEDTLSRLSGTA